MSWFLSAELSNSSTTEAEPKAQEAHYEDDVRGVSAESTRVTAPPPHAPLTINQISENHTKLEGGGGGGEVWRRMKTTTAPTTTR